MAPHVLVVGIDGVRYDAVRRLHTPHLDTVAAAGFLRPVTVNRSAPTISGPSWTTIVTGLLAPRHGVFDNDLSTRHLDAGPDFLTLARQSRPGLVTWVGADWEPLVTADSGGPLFAGGGFLPDRRRDAGAGPDDWHHADQQVVDRAATQIAALSAVEGSITFAYLHGPDLAGHGTGVSQTYRDFVAASDRRLGQLLAAVAERPGRADETWLVVVATDHGHVDVVGGHGGDTEAERTAWIAACGPGVPTGAAAAGLVLEQADVAAHVLHVLDIEPVATDFAGFPFGQREQLAESS